MFDLINSEDGDGRDNQHSLPALWRGSLQLCITPGMFYITTRAYCNRLYRNTASGITAILENIQECCIIKCIKRTLH